MELNRLYKIFIKNRGISIDSRTVKNGDIFFALKGEKVDGNVFAEESIKKGAEIAIVDDEKYSDEKNIFYDENPIKLLQNLALEYRKSLKIPIIAVTGTNGKTTSKEIISEVLGKRYNAFKTLGNLNNHIGVPLSILSILPENEIAVIEMGASKKGDIKELCDITLPNYGYITNFGEAHLEGFKSFENIVETKTELYQFIKDNDGILFINDDDDIQMKKALDIKKYSFGSNGNYVKSSFISALPFIKMEIDGVIIQTRLIGDYNFNNLVSAFLIGKYFGVEKQDMIYIISNFQTNNNRTQVIEKNSNFIIMDCYNANPSSMKAAINNFDKNIKSEKKILILGDMMELGDKSNQEHKKIIDFINKLRIYKIYLIGKEFFNCKTDIENFSFFEDFNDFSQIFKLEKDSYYLVKGSRSIKLERIQEFI